MCSGLPVLEGRAEGVCLSASCCSLSTRGRRETMPLAKPSCHSRQTNSVVCTSCSASFPTTCSQAEDYLTFSPQCASAHLDA